MKGKSLFGVKGMKKRSFVITLGFIITCVLTLTGYTATPEATENPYLTKAEELYNNYDFAEAYKLLEDGYEKDRNNEEIIYWLIKTANTSYLLDSPNPGNTTPYPSIDKIIESSRDSHDVKILTEIGRFHWLRNKREEAIEYFKKAIDINSNYYPAYNYLGNYYSQSDPAAGAKYYEKLFKLNPDGLDFIDANIGKDVYEQILKNNNLKELYLSSSNTVLLKGIGALKELEVLFLIKRSVTSTDLKYIRKLTKLKALSLHANQISKIAGLDNLVNLRILHLNDNQISTIENLDQLTNLKILDLRSNQITKLENLDALTGLQRLYLSHNRIKKIENLDALKQLTILELYDNQIYKLENLAKLTNLKTLHLYFNQISKLENLDTLTNLRHLYMRGNKISTIENLDRLSNLEILDLYENQVKKLENLAQLIRLKELILFNNHIGKIENLDTLTSLRTLDMRKNTINKIEDLDMLTNLSVLMLSFNGINKLENLDKLNNLQELYASYNKISKIENLDSLNGLQKLYLGGNDINTIENLDSLNNLKHLYLADNHISKMENLSKLTNLLTLNLRNNKISRIENLYGLTHLEILDLSDNRINELGDFAGLANLRYLYLSNNQIGMKGDTKLVIPSAFINLKGLIISGPDYMHPGNIKYLYGVDNLKNIEEFMFSYQNLIELPDLSSLKNIKKLHIEKCVNMKTIDYGKIPSGIQSLTLWNVNLKGLQGIERLVNLKELWVGDNPGLRTLSRLNDIKTLKEVNIGLCSHLPPEEILKLNNIRTLIIAVDQYPMEVIEALKRKGIKVEMY